MQHNNSFPSEASGVEPIVCTLLKLWMLPLLQRAYINLAGSKQQCGASIPSPRLTSFSVASISHRCRKKTSRTLFPAWRRLAAVRRQRDGSIGGLSYVMVQHSCLPHAQEVRWSQDMLVGDFSSRSMCPHRCSHKHACT